ncbi:hypothetical protein [Aeromonas veronii]|jgi:hypothetical protein
MNTRTQITVQRLRDALQRLLDGKPQRTKPDNKISLSRINMEAGCSHGLLYKYPDLVCEFKIVIERHKTLKQSVEQFKHISSNISKEAKLQARLNKQKELTRNYRTQRNNLQTLADDAIKRECELLFYCHELQIELNKHKKSKVTLLY